MEKMAWHEDAPRKLAEWKGEMGELLHVVELLGKVMDITTPLKREYAVSAMRMVWRNMKHLDEGLEELICAMEEAGEFDGR